MTNLRITAAAFALASGCGFASPAFAEPILFDDDAIGESYTLTFDGFVDGGPSLNGLSSQLQLTLLSIVGGQYQFDYSIANTGASDDGVTSRLSGFAFNTDPMLASSDSTGTFNRTQRRKNYPNGIGKVDVCFKAGGGNSCAGGGDGGLFEGETGAGIFNLDFGSQIDSLTLDDFFVRYQSIHGLGHIGSASGRQTSTTTSSTGGGTDVPAPGMLAIMLGSVLALFGLRRRKVRGARPANTPAFA